MKRQQRLLTALFLLFLFAGLAWSLALPKRDFSETENRSLAQWPAFSWKALRDGNFTKDVESFLSDQFPLRDGWIALKSGAEYVLGLREFHGVYLCGDALIAKVDEPEPAEVEKRLGFLQKLCDKTDLPVYGAFIPSAAEVWRQKLPKGAASCDQEAFLRQVREQTQVQYVDLLTPLVSKKEEPIYYRTDHHWTSLGAYYGYCALVQAMGRQPALLEGPPQTVTESFCGTLYSKSGVHWLQPDSIQTYVPEGTIAVTGYQDGKLQPGVLYDETYLEKKDKYSMFLGGNQPLCILENPQAPEGTVLVVRDSYCDAMAPFLAQSFSQVYLVDLRYYRASVSEMARQYGADAIVVLYSVPNFLTDADLVFLGQ